MVFFGAVSYSLYLLHQPVLRVLAGSIFLRGNLWLFLPLFLAAATVVAALSYRYIEEPLRRWLGGETGRGQGALPLDPLTPPPPGR